MIRERFKRGAIGKVGVMGEGSVRVNDRNRGCGSWGLGRGGEEMVVRRWVWIWGGVIGSCGCDMGGCERWVQVMERVKIEGMEREGVRKRVNLPKINMLHRSSKDCTQYKSN